MGPALIALLLVQTPAPKTPARELRNGLSRNYRVSVEQESGDHFGYRLGMKVLMPKAARDKVAETSIEVKLTNYKASVGGRAVSVTKMGGGLLQIASTGLPLGLEIAGTQGPIWLPLLAFYYPATDKDGDFLVDRTQVGTGTFVTGTGTLSHPGGKATLSFEMSLLRGETPLGKVSLSATLDDQGWPKKAEGVLKSEDGTYQFTLAG
jgi:hypothetical protein